MKILKIKTEGFRAFPGIFETEFYNITQVAGANRKGKTNILHAIVWGFLGCSLSGDDKVWLGNKKSNECRVSITFEDNQGLQHFLVRYKHKTKAKNNSILLDNKIVGQEDLINYYQDKKLFLSIMNQNYFLSKTPAEQKNLISKYLADVNIKAVFDKLDNYDKKILISPPSNIKLLIDDINKEKAFIEDKNKEIKGKIEYANNIANQKIESKKEFDKDEELTLSLQELDFLKTEYATTGREKENTIKELKQFDNQIEDTTTRISELETKMKKGKITYLGIKNNNNAKCPTCGQFIRDESKTRTIKNMHNELSGYYDEKVKLVNSLTDMKFKRVQSQCKLNALSGDAILEKEQRIKTSDENVKRLQDEERNINLFNKEIDVKEQAIQDAKKNIVDFEQQREKYNNQLEKNKEEKKIASKLYINYLEEKMKPATKYLKNVKIKYYSVLKETGEIKEDFIITYNNNTIKELSRSETIATSLEIANMFNKISGINLPLFIDDYESCLDYNFIDEYSSDTQIIFSKVEKGQELAITEYSNDTINIKKAA